jgi:molybdenum cofactor cytidylyltransferase
MPRQNKLLLPLGGKTIIAHTVDHLLQSKAGEVIVVLGHEAKAVQRALPGRNVVFITNPNFIQGLSTSIIAGLQAAAKSAQGFLISLADLPLVTFAELNLLIQCFFYAGRYSIIAPAYQGRRGNPVIFDRRHLPEMLAISGDAGCKSILAQYQQLVLEVEMQTDHVLCDIDTLEAYEAVQARLSQLRK